MSRLDPHENEIREAAITGSASQRDLSSRYGVARSTLQEWCARKNIKFQAQPLSLAKRMPAAAGAPVDEVEVVKAERDEYRRRLRRERQGDVAQERALDVLREAVKAPVPEFAPVEFEVTENSKPHVQALLLSDLHGGEVVNPEAVDGLNEYNWQIMEERMESIVHSLLSFQANRPYPIDELQIWQLGDMCSGANHEELRDTNEYPLVEQGWRMGLMLGQFVEKLAPHYPAIKVYGVAGNHPRLDKKPSAKHVFNNMDWMAYKVQETYLKNFDNVECDFPQAGMQVVNIVGKNVLLFHGDGVRSSMVGVPWGGLIRYSRELRSQYQERDVKLDCFAFGHFHIPNVIQGYIFGNGSVKGLDEWSLKQFGHTAPPTQLLTTWDPEKSRLTDVSFITP